MQLKKLILQVYKEEKLAKMKQDETLRKMAQKKRK